MRVSLLVCCLIASLLCVALCEPLSLSASWVALCASWGHCVPLCLCVWLCVAVGWLLGGVCGLGWGREGVVSLCREGS